MTELQQIEQKVKTLSSADLRQFRKWFVQWDSDSWDQQIERDAQAGRLDDLAAEALAEYQAGKAKEI